MNGTSVQPLSLRIGIDATSAGIAGSAHTGVYQYIHQLIREVGRQSPQSELRLLFALPKRRHSASISDFCDALDLPNAVPRRCPVPSKYLMRWRIPADLFTGPIDVFHAPAHIGCHLRRCPLVLTVHDLAYLRNLCSDRKPAGLSTQAASNWQDRRRFFSELAQHMARSLADAARVIAVSQHTADDLVATLGVDRAKIRVVYPGLREGIRHIGSAARRLTLERYGIEDGYFLYVGSLDPNKNIPVLIEAYAGYRQSKGRRLLVIAGNSDFFASVLHEQCQRLGIESHVRFLGFVPDTDLPSLYSGACAVVMPSPLEGFGFPVIEAMACATPVIGANAGALPEVIGAAGLVVAHDRPPAFAEAFHQLEEDLGLRERLIEAGLRRVTDFTWKRAAQQTLGVYADASARFAQRHGEFTGAGRRA